MSFYIFGSPQEISALKAHGAPYPPQTQGLGSPPTPIPDVPVSAIFLVLFLLAGTVHVSLFVRNKKLGHFFPFSMAMFSLCLIRVISTALRMGWAYHERNISLAIAEQIFVVMGSFILYIVNLFFVQRLMRARHPHIGWHKVFSIFFPFVFLVLLVLGILMIIVVILQSFYTLNGNTKRIDRDVFWYVQSLFTFVAFLPVPVVAIMMILPAKVPLDKFGHGGFRTKIIFLILSSLIVTLGAAFRAGTSFLAPTPTTEPLKWYYSKACFYCFDLLTDFLAVAFYAVVRVDLRFHVPDRADGAGSYSRGRAVSTEKPLADESSGDELS